MRRFRSKFVVFVALIFFLGVQVPRQAEAVLPFGAVLLAPEVIGGAIALAGAAGAYYALNNSSPSYSKSDTDHSVFHDAWMIQQFAYTAGTDYLVGQAFSAALSMDNAIGYIKQNAAALPVLAGLVHSTADQRVPAPGDVIASPDGHDGVTAWHLDSTYATGAPQAYPDFQALDGDDPNHICPSSGTPPGCSYITHGANQTIHYLTKWVYDGHSGSYYYWHYVTWRITASSDALTDLDEPDPAAFFSAIDTADPGTQDELENLYGQSGLVSVAPGFDPTPLTPSQLAAVGSQLSADQAQAIADASADFAAANPEDPQAQIAAQQAALAAAQVQAAANQAEEPTTTPPSVLSDAPAPAALDFTPLYALKDAVITHYPFAWISNLAGYYSVLIADPRAPVFSCPNGFGGQIVIDLATLDDIASRWRGCLLFFMNGAMVYAVVRRWS